MAVIFVWWVYNPVIVSSICHFPLNSSFPDLDLQDLRIQSEQKDEREMQQKAVRSLRPATSVVIYISNRMILESKKSLGIFVHRYHQNDIGILVNLCWGETENKKLCLVWWSQRRSPWCLVSCAIWQGRHATGLADESAPERQSGFGGRRQNEMWPFWWVHGN